MSKTTNKDLWKLFVFLAEGLNERTFLMASTDEEQGMGLIHTGIGMQDMEVSFEPHPYLPMTRIKVNLNPPAEVIEYLETDLSHDKVAAGLRDYLATRGDIVYTVYNEVMGTFTKELENAYGSLFSEHPNFDAVKAMVEYLGNLMMSEMAKDVAKKANKYYPLAVNRNWNITVHEPSDEWIEEKFGAMTSGDITRAEQMVTRAGKQIAHHLAQTGKIVNEWSGKTAEIRDYDLWFSLDIQDHKIHLGLDRQPYRSEDTYTIERTPVDLEQWQEADREIIASIETHIDEMNIIVGNLLNHNTTYTMLNDEIEQMYIRAIHHPVARHTVRVWSFDDVCAEGRAKIDEEISWMLETIANKGAELDQDVKLDISNMYLHSAAANQRYILNDDQQVIVERCKTYAGSFYDALQQHLYDVETELFGPYTNVKPADMDNQKFISESDLLNPPTVH